MTDNTNTYLREANALELEFYWEQINALHEQIRKLARSNLAAQGVELGRRLAALFRKIGYHSTPAGIFIEEEPDILAGRGEDEILELAGDAYQHALMVMRQGPCRE